MIVTELLGKLGLEVDKSSFAKGDQAIKGIGGRLGGFVKLAAGAFAVTKVIGFVNGLVQAGSALNDAAIRLGVTTNALQELNFAAEQTGATSADLENGLKFLSKNAVAAAGGSAELSAAYKKLGVNVKDSNGEIKSSEVLLGEVAEGLSKTDNASERTALAVKLLGRGGAALLPMLVKGEAGLAAFRKEFAELGGGFDEEFVENADKVGDNLDRLRLLSTSLKSAIGNVLLPVIDRVLTKLIDWGKVMMRVLKGSEFIRASLILLATVSAITAAQALLPWVPVVLLFVGLAAVIDEIYNLMTGGKSIIGEWLDEWLGVGTVDRFVRRWAGGVEILVKNLKDLFKLATENPVEALLAPFKGTFQLAQDLGDMHGREAAWAEKEKEIRRQREIGGAMNLALANALEDDLRTSRGDDVAAGRGMGAKLKMDESIPRTTRRGIDAPLAAGSAGFGFASQDAVSPLLRPGNISAAQSSVGGGTARGSAMSNAGGGVVVGDTNVTVQATTNADPKEIARIAGDVAEKKHKEQAKRVRNALTNRTPRGE